jgi:hypothetical protein
MGVEEHFEFISVFYEVIGVPDGKLQKFSHYVSLARTVVRRFALIPVGQRGLHHRFELVNVITLL